MFFLFLKWTRSNVQYRIEYIWTPAWIKNRYLNEDYGYVPNEPDKLRTAGFRHYFRLQTRFQLYETRYTFF